MLDPHDDTDVPSGSTDGAPMESTSSPVLREQAACGPTAVGWLVGVWTPCWRCARIRGGAADFAVLR